MRRYSRRELPPYRHLPGRTPHPERHPDGYHYGRAEPAGSALEESSFRGNEDYLHGIDLFNAGYYWEAHAAWEAVWGATPRGAPASRLLQALVQLSAALLKRELGEDEGARKLSKRSLEKLRALRGERGQAVFMGLDLEKVARDATAVLEEKRVPAMRLSLASRSM